ncbi:MAG: metal ABC transporter substrate-binding protein [Planctomycetota bacterium]
MIAWLVAFALVACERQAATPLTEAASVSEPASMRVAVTIAPLAGLVAPLLPEGAEIRILTPIGASPHGWEATPSVLAAAYSAELIVGIGMGLDDRMIAPAERLGRRTVRFDAVLAELPEDQRRDPHLWLDPDLCVGLVDRVAAELIEAGLEADAVDRDRAAMVEAIRGVEDAYRDRLAPHAGAGVITHHNAWGRLFPRYSIEVAGVIRKIETAEPTPAAIATAVRAVEEARAQVIIIEPQFAADAADTIAKRTGAALATMDPLGSGDWFEMMTNNLDALAAALAEAQLETEAEGGIVQ